MMMKEAKVQYFHALEQKREDGMDQLEENLYRALSTAVFNQLNEI